MNEKQTKSNASPATTGQIIKNAVRNFMRNRRACYATPGAGMHSSGFYGDAHICRFTRAQLAGLIEMLHKNYGAGVCVSANEPRENAFTLEEACEMVIRDMQFNRPE